MTSIRKMLESREHEILSSFATKSTESAGRTRPEEQDSIRTDFQRDRDRILHSKPFRRLKHKTQVFISPEGDHYRTRLTHTLEVSQIARTVGRALRLNEDLIEAIALGHDVGHPPFGHAGEQALDRSLAELYQKSQAGPGKFLHYEQSWRVLMVLEDLNLTQEVQDGINGHSKGQKDLEDADGQRTSTLEAAVVRISDRIAYLNHDLDDALRAGMIQSVPPVAEKLGTSHGKRIGAIVENLVENSLDKPAISVSPDLLASLNELKDWLFENVYFHYPMIMPDIDKSKHLVSDLFSHYLTDGALPMGFTGVQGAVDYVSGMTDRFAIQTFEELRLPKGYPL